MSILVIGDCHFPFHCRKAFRAMFRAIAGKEFSHIIQMGDLYDFYSFSRYPRSHNLIKPAEEIKLARDAAEEMWLRLQDLFPSAKCLQLLGNHDLRTQKLLFSKLPEFESILNIAELWKFDGVYTAECQREEIFIKDICFVHGHYTKPGDHLNYNQMNTVIGHSHRGYTLFHRIKDQILFELNAGCLADLDSKPLAYTSQKKLSKMQNGFGIIDELGPRFIPIIDGKITCRV